MLVTNVSVGQKGLVYIVVEQQSYHDRSADLSGNSLVVHQVSPVGRTIVMLF